MYLLSPPEISNFATVRNMENSQTHLIPKHADGARSGDLVRAEPHGRQTRWHPEDEHLGDRATELSEHGHPKQAGLDAEHLDPSPGAVERVGHQRRDAQPLVIQEPRGREDEGNVRDHVNHGQPVDGHRGHAVVVDDDVADDGELVPLEGVAHGVGEEEENNDPALLVQVRWLHGAAVRDGALGLISRSFRRPACVLRALVLGFAHVRL